jgi:dolichol kinase
MMGVVIVGIYLAGISRHTGVLIMGALLALDLFLETARLRSPSLNEKVLRVWGPLMRACEVNKLSGTPYYLAAAILAVAIFPKPIAVLSILYLACGDPIASLVGIRWGDLSVRFPNGKSLIGALAGMSVCALISWFGLQDLQLDPLRLGILTAVGALAGGGAELLPLEIDDNFSIPIVSGFALWFAFILLSV